VLEAGGSTWRLGGWEGNRGAVGQRSTVQMGLRGGSDDLNSTLAGYSRWGKSLSLVGLKGNDVPKIVFCSSSPRKKKM